jgi:hypothetical protein
LAHIRVANRTEPSRQEVGEALAPTSVIVVAPRGGRNALVALDRGERQGELAHRPHQGGGLVAVELASCKSLRDRVDRTRRVGERDELGHREVERSMPQPRDDAVQAGPQRRRVAVGGAFDRRPRHLAGAVVQQLLGDDGARVARSGRASRRISTLAGLKAHARFSFLTILRDEARREKTRRRKIQAIYRAPTCAKYRKGR